MLLRFLAEEQQAVRTTQPRGAVWLHHLDVCECTPWLCMTQNLLTTYFLGCFPVERHALAGRCIKMWILSWGCDRFFFCFLQINLILRERERGREEKGETEREGERHKNCTVDSQKVRTYPAFVSNYLRWALCLYSQVFWNSSQWSRQEKKPTWTGLAKGDFLA